MTCSCTIHRGREIAPSTIRFSRTATVTGCTTVARRSKRPPAGTRFPTTSPVTPKVRTGSTGRVPTWDWWNFAVPEKTTSSCPARSVTPLSPSRTAIPTAQPNIATKPLWRFTNHREVSTSIPLPMEFAGHRCTMHRSSQRVISTPRTWHFGTPCGSVMSVFIGHSEAGQVKSLRPAKKHRPKM